MCQAAYQIINPGKRYVLKYTTVSGVDGFDGTRKEAPKAVVKAFDWVVISSSIFIESQSNSAYTLKWRDTAFVL